MTSTPDTLTNLFNLPDLIILAIVLVNIVLGLRQGFVRSLCGLVGKLAAIAGAIFAARTLAPGLARFVVTPIVGKVFETRVQNFGGSALQGLQQTVTEAAAGMAESVAFIALLILFSVLFGWLVTLASKGLHFLAHLTPLGILDSLGGGVIGAASGLVLVSLILIGIEWFSPITYTTLGWLSPQRVEDTVLLARLIGLLPVAI
ncbi:CvpA family protein [Butyricicoccus sp. Marseille-Q5471]|uniref:CvpA family protein n=1 Tax=Butyricicoccus sp. Marseille-Q5471 TaxID=3039493 RepID=UPI0024BCB40D|nr:CvpA family protein [Butyricicoccus sp. Marseille-Q5471]